MNGTRNKRDKNKWLAFAFAAMMLSIPLPNMASPGNPSGPMRRPNGSPMENSVPRPLPEEPLAPKAPK